MWPSGARLTFHRERRWPLQQSREVQREAGHALITFNLREHDPYQRRDWSVHGEHPGPGPEKGFQKMAWLPWRQQSALKVHF